MGTNHLVLAALRGDIDDVRQIIKHDKLVRLDDHFLEHGNALQAASKGGYLEIVKLLIAKGSDVNWNGGHYGNPLSAAAYHKHVDVVRYLCENGAEVNTTHSGFCYSPLNAAIEGGSKEIVELLIKNHADVNLGRGGGPSYITALDVALFRGDDEITQLLYDAGASMTRRECKQPEKSGTLKSMLTAYRRRITRA